MKDEKIMAEFVALRPKTYSHLMDDDMIQTLKDQKSA